MSVTTASNRMLLSTNSSTWHDTATSNSSEPEPAQNPRPEGADRLEDAVTRGNVAQAQAVLDEFPALLKTALREGSTVLHLAASVGSTDIIAFLALQDGIDLNPVDDQGRTPLHLAIEKGQALAAEKLLGFSGVNADARLPSGATAFYLAVERGQTELAGLLMKCGAAFNPCRLDGQSAFHAVCEAGHTEAVTWMIQQLLLSDPKGNDLRVMLNRFGPKGVTPLLQAAQSGRAAVVDLLLAQPIVRPNDGDCEGRTALHAALAAGHAQIALALLNRNGVEVDGKLQNGATPLMLALANDDLVVVKRLREKGASIDARLQNGSSMLHIACEKCGKDTIGWLLQQGLDPSAINERNDDEKTPLLVAALVNNVAAAKVLLGQGQIDPNAGDADGLTALHWASLEGNAELIDALLAHTRGNHPIDPNARDNDGLTPLDRAMEEQSVKGIRRLAQSAEVDVNIPNQKGWPPLHQAIRLGRIDIAHALLSAPGTDPTRLGPHGHNILHMLSQVEDDALALQLVQAIRAAIRTPGVYEALIHQPNVWGTLPVSVAAQQGRSQALIDALRPRTVAPSQEIAAKTATSATAFKQGWLIAGPDLYAWEKRQLADLGEKGGIPMEAYGNGKQDLTWKGLQALKIQPGDVVICNFHAVYNQDLKTVVLEFGDSEFVPLVDVARLFVEKRVAKALFTGCEVGSAVESLLAGLNNDPTISKPTDREGGYSGPEITVVGRERATLNTLNQDASQFFLEDCIHQLKTGTAGTALSTRSVQPMATIRGNPAQQQFELARREALAADQLDPRLNPGEIKTIRESLLLTHIHDFGEGNEESDKELKKADLLLNVDPTLVHAQYDGGTSALQVASTHGKEAMVKKLLLFKADTLHCDDNGASALFGACMLGHTKIVDLLLNHGADIHGTTLATTGLYTSLHAACENGHIDVVSLLLDKGASTTATTDEGLTPMELAQVKEQHNIVALFKTRQKQLAAMTSVVRVYTNPNISNN
ncbi:ankyrin repeat domain-containing protein [Hydrogenophaga sp.]|uniref:ankyrin repeat domain-containing protein n=1 Tax=Hydrogenophaga sp. TaxID=1904254 RepID=UPI00271C36CE|nr:ankyrin repeat domain-containing protein [Hydrogenophaga sp.]MDO9435210.1 ankyrin repeat domain-containing protein [Hydrogenophaga sp.]